MAAPPPPPPPPGFPIRGPAQFPPIPPPWTQHTAPNGTPYWFNPITNVSTYVRPQPPPPPGFHIAPPPVMTTAALPALHYQPLVAPTAAAAPTKLKQPKEKKEKPRTKTRVGDSPWIRVVTNKGNVFYNHSETKESVWQVPDEIKDAVDELDAQERREREKHDEEEERRRLEQEEQAAAAAAAAAEEQAQNGKKRKADAERDGDDAEQHEDLEEAAEEEEDDDDEGEERGDLDIEIEGGEARAVPDVTAPLAPDAELPPPTADAPDAETAPPPAKRAKLSPAPTGPGPETKDVPPQQSAAATAPRPTTKKPKKNKVVSSLEDLNDEDWQRQIAEEMAREAEEGPDGTSNATQVEEKVAAVAAAPVQQQQQQLEVDQVEAAALYTVLLSERGINPMAPFETELPKFVNDPRYHAVKTQRDRRDLFDQFCKDKIREQRAAKKRAAESGIKLDPLTAYRHLLATAVTSTRTHFSDFKRSHAKDARFREFGKTEGEREKEFKKWLRELGEKKREAAERADREFGEMLSEDREIRSGDKWTEVKKRHASDPRYAAVNSSSLREQLFNKHLASLASGSSSHPTASTSNSASATSASASASTSAAKTKEDKAARAAASLREREEKVRLEQMKSARSAERARGHLGKDEAEREFAQLLVDAVRDHNARFDDVAPSIANDSRFDAPSLTPSDKRRLFDSHQQKLYRSRVGDVEALFSAHSPTLITPFDNVLPPISSDPHVVRLVGTDFDQLESLYSAWQARRTRQARDDFTQMLKENSILEHWGRMKKMDKREKGKLIGEEGVREDSEDEEPDSREMAEQIDLKAIHSVLRNDKRYLEFNHFPEDRERWVEDYVNNLAAPKTTVHQRE